MGSHIQLLPESDHFRDNASENLHTETVSTKLPWIELSLLLLFITRRSHATFKKMEVLTGEKYNRAGSSDHNMGGFPFRVLWVMGFFHWDSSRTRRE